jgi:hypothetical protein
MQSNPRQQDTLLFFMSEQIKPGIRTEHCLLKEISSDENLMSQALNIQSLSSGSTIVGRMRIMRFDQFLLKQLNQNQYCTT